MNKIIKILVLLASLPVLQSMALSRADAVHMSLPDMKDTVEIQFGDKGRIIIQVDSPRDLEMLKSYDINKMIADLQISVEESGDSTEILIIEDPSGDRYHQGNEDPEFRALEELFSEGIERRGDADANTLAVQENKKAEEIKRGTWYAGSRTMFNTYFDIGMNNYVEDGTFPDASDAQYTVRPWGSWYIALQPGCQTHIAGKFALQYSAGVSWYNFKFQDASTRMIKGEEGVIYERWDPDLKAAKSKLTVAHLNASLVPMLDFGYRKKVRALEDGSISRKIAHRDNGFRIGAGAYVGYRIDSYTKLVSRAEGGKDKSREHSGYYLENIRYGARVVIGYGGVDLFVNYDLSNMFAPGRGPELNAFSFGLSF